VSHSHAVDANGPRLGALVSGKNKGAIESCTRKCVPTCVRGGEGAPGLGPLSVRKEIVVFKDGFRSRGYCLRECAEVCALSINGPGPGAPASATEVSGGSDGSRSKAGS